MLWFKFGFGLKYFKADRSVIIFLLSYSLSSSETKETRNLLYIEDKLFKKKKTFSLFYNLS